jgi:hypothetical protein
MTAPDSERRPPGQEEAPRGESENGSPTARIVVPLPVGLRSRCQPDSRRALDSRADAIRSIPRPEAPTEGHASSDLLAELRERFKR